MPSTPSQDDLADRYEDLADRYRRYLAACNAHEFDRLTEFVDPAVQVNGEDRGLAGYVADLEAVVRAFPDLRWDLRHLLVDGDRVCAHLTDTGTHRGAFRGVPATGRPFHTQEFALYRFTAGRIVEFWGTGDDLGLLDQLR